MTINNSHLAGLLEALLLAVKVIIAGIVIMVLYKAWNFMFGMETSQFMRAALTSSEESDLVVTSFAQVDLLYLKDDGDEILIPSPATAVDLEAIVDNGFRVADKFCLHSYEVVFGYPSLSQQRGMADIELSPPVSEPEIVAVNVLRSENAPDSSTRWCQSKNLKKHREALEESLRFALNYDDVLKAHLTHGQLALAATLDLGQSACRVMNGSQPDAAAGCFTDALAASWQRQLEAFSLEGAQPVAAGAGSLAEVVAATEGVESLDDVADLTSLNALIARIDRSRRESFEFERSIDGTAGAANLGADVASVLLTFSTTLGISQQRKRFLGLWTSKRFYLQRDVAKVYYGTSLSPAAISTSWRAFGPNQVRLEFPEPSIIALDRFSSFVVTRNKIEKSKSRQSLANYLNQQMLDALEGAVERFHRRAVKASEAILINRIPRYFDLAAAEYAVSFSRPRDPGPDLTFLPGVIDLEPSTFEGDE